MVGTLHVSLFHRFRVHHDNQRMEMEIRKVQELFSFLILFHAKGHHREALADRLWQETPALQSRRLLRKTLWQLQSILKEKKEVLRVEPEWIQIVPEADVWVDAIVFEQVYNSVHGLSGHQLAGSQVESLRMAVDLYVGDLLEGWYSDWCVYERQRFQFMYMAMLDKLVGHYEVHGNYELGIGYATRILSFDATREHTHRQLMILHYLAGDRRAALQQFDRCRMLLDKEIGVEPDASTLALYAQLCADSVPGASRRQEAFTGAPAENLSILLDRLRHVHMMLGDLQIQVEQEIARVNELTGAISEHKTDGGRPGK